MQQPQQAKLSILAAVILHNFLRENPAYASVSETNEGLQCPIESFQHEEVPSEARITDPDKIRIAMQEYFCHEGVRDFQYQRSLDH